MPLLPFQLPNEVLIASLYARYPCRENQIRALATLLSPWIPSPRNIVLHGSEATGKSAVIAAILSALSPNDEATNENRELEVLGDDTVVRHAIVKSDECITGRHLLETTVAAVAKAVDWKGNIGRCENLAQLMVEVARLLEAPKKQLGSLGLPAPPEKFILVFDGMDRQRDPPSTLLPALARLGEIIPDLTIIFVVTSPRPHFLHTSNIPYIHFPAYTKSEAVRITSLSPPPLYPPRGSPIPDDLPNTQQTSTEIYPRFVSAVWDTLSKHSGRDIISLRNICLRLWPSFTSLIRDGTYSTKDFSRILIAKRPLLQDERVLIPSIVPASSQSSQNGINGISESIKRSSGGLATQLPLISRLLLTAAYLCSHTPSRFDMQLFSRSSALRKKKKGGGTALSRSRPGVSKSRKISRKLLGPQAFVLERMMAVFWTLAEDSWVWKRGGTGGLRGLAGSADVQMAISTLASLRLLQRIGGTADVLDGSSKWKVNVGWEVVRGVARSVGVEVEDYLVD